MTVDNLAGLAARDALLSAVRLWPILEALVARSGNQAITGMPGGGEADTLPIDTHVIDLMTEIRHDVALHYARVLIDDTAGGDTAWKPDEDDTATLLRAIADRYGHFIAHDRWAARFVQDAHGTLDRIRRACAPPPPPIYLGPCPANNCDGELYLHQDRDSGRCPKCSTPFDRASHEAWLAEQMADRLLTQTETQRALTTLGAPVTDRTIRRWVAAGKLIAVEEGLYRLADALELTPKRLDSVTPVR